MSHTAFFLSFLPQTASKDPSAIRRLGIHIARLSVFRKQIHYQQRDCTIPLAPGDARDHSTKQLTFQKR
jgi:hypothetical protein